MVENRRYPDTFGLEPKYIIRIMCEMLPLHMSFILNLGIYRYNSMIEIRK